MYDIAINKEELDSKESYYINKFDCINNGYNFKEGGSQGKFSLETRKKMSESKTGEKNSNFGKKFSKEVRLKMSLGKKYKYKGVNNHHYGKHLDSKTIEKISRVKKSTKQWKGENNYWYGKGNLLLGENNPNYGNKWSEEMKLRASEQKKGKYIEKDNPNYGNRGELNSNSKKIICIETNIIYYGASEASRKLQYKSPSSIIECCKGKRKSAGKHPETGEKLRWMYYEEYIKQKK